MTDRDNEILSFQLVLPNTYFVRVKTDKSEVERWPIAGWALVRSTFRDSGESFNYLKPLFVGQTGDLELDDDCAGQIVGVETPPEPE